MRVDTMAALFTVSLATYLTYFAKMDASNIGFSLSMASESSYRTLRALLDSENGMSVAASTKVFEWVRTFNALDLAGKY